MKNKCSRRVSLPEGQVRCALCRKPKGIHKAVTLHCPVGMKTRVGYVQFSATETYTSNGG